MTDASGRNVAARTGQAVLAQQRATILLHKVVSHSLRSCVFFIEQNVGPHIEQKC